MPVVAVVLLVGLVDLVEMVVVQESLVPLEAGQIVDLVARNIMMVIFQQQVYCHPERLVVK